MRCRNQTIHEFSLPISFGKRWLFQRLFEPLNHCFCMGDSIQFYKPGGVKIAAIFESGNPFFDIICSQFNAAILLYTLLLF